MPIRPQNKDRYPADWPAISLAAKQAAQWRCACQPLVTAALTRAAELAAVSQLTFEAVAGLAVPASWPCDVAAYLVRTLRRRTRPSRPGTERPNVTWRSYSWICSCQYPPLG